MRRARRAAVPAHGRGCDEEIRSARERTGRHSLERVGNSYVLSEARFRRHPGGGTGPRLELGDQPYVGLFVCAHNDTVVERATSATC